MLILCKGLQRVTAEHQTRVTAGKVTELVAAFCSSMDRKFHKIEYKYSLRNQHVWPTIFKKLAFNDNRDLQRISAAAARYGQPTPLPGGQEGEDTTEDEQEEPQASAVWRCFEERATGNTTRRNPSADAILEVRSYLEKLLFQRSADKMIHLTQDFISES